MDSALKHYALKAVYHMTRKPDEAEVLAKAEAKEAKRLIRLERKAANQDMWNAVGYMAIGAGITYYIMWLIYVAK